MSQHSPTRWPKWYARWQKVRRYYFAMLLGLAVMHLLLWLAADTRVTLFLLQLVGSSLFLTILTIIIVLRPPQFNSADAPAQQAGNDSAHPGEGVVILDSDARILQADARTAALLGYTPLDLVGRSVVELLPQLSAADALPLLEQLTEGETMLAESTLQRKNGPPLLADLTVRRLSSGHFQVIVQSAERGYPVGETENAVQQHRSQLAALYEVGRALSQTLDMQEIFRVMYRDVARRIFGAPHFSIALYDEATQMITCGYAVVDGEEIDPAQLPPMPLGEGPNSDCIRTHQPRHIDLDAARQRLVSLGRMVQIGDERVPKSALYVPLIADNRVIAVLNMQRYEADSLAGVDIDFLRTLASLAAVALANARLVAAERIEHDLADALLNTATALISSLEVETVMQRILESVGQVVPHDSANIMVIEAENSMRVLYARGYMTSADSPLVLPQEVLTWPAFQTMLDTQEPYIIPDTRQSPNWVTIGFSSEVTSYLGVPIVVDEQVIGFINLDSMTPGFFTAAHAHKLRAFAAQAALALQNARLYEEVRLYAGQLQVLVAARTTEIDRERAQLNIILETMAESVVFVTGTQVTYCNTAFSRLTGFTQPELRSLSAPRLYDRLFGHGDNAEAVLNELRAFHSPGKNWQRELVLQRKDGARVDVRMALSRAIGPGGVELGTLVLLQDISRAKALQAQKDRFITHASHELRTPITNLKMRLYLLERAPEHLSEHLAVLKQTTNILHHLVQDMLELTELQSGEPILQPDLTSVQTIIGSALDTAAETLAQRQITAELHAPLQPLRLLADQARLIQAFINLMAYLVAVLPPQSRLCWHVEAEDGAALVVLECSERPKGLETTGDVFDPFYQASEGGAPGTGLGLAIAREIIQLHGGEVGLAGEYGAGSVFFIRLPLSSAGIDRQG